MIVLDLRKNVTKTELKESKQKAGNVTQETDNDSF